MLESRLSLSLVSVTVALSIKWARALSLFSLSLLGEVSFRTLWLVEGWVELSLSPPSLSFSFSLSLLLLLLPLHFFILFLFSLYLCLFFLSTYVSLYLPFPLSPRPLSRYFISIRLTFTVRLTLP